ncbi:MAG TPA: (2Fe-2S)-binding protein [Pseudonocardiaceae bacterium]|jgi:carbon-monoxide dehydrogenase small subunit|nr:(2Fe-2S)-binding protein [Pseudonocardiaceae bacterium]
MRTDLKVNGSPVEADVEPRVLLVDLLRDTLGLTGTKVACDTGQCGSCVVHVNGLSQKSCAILAVQARGADVTTVEGVGAAGELTPLQDALREVHGTQCGFCTPGMVLSLLELLRRNPKPTEPEIRTWLTGNLCRCTGYHSVVRAVLRLAEAAGAPAEVTR